MEHAPDRRTATALLSLRASSARLHFAGAVGKRSRTGDRFRVKQVGGLGAQTQLDKRAGVRHHLTLPAMIVLETSHGFSGVLVPTAARLALEILFANQGLLNLARPFVLNAMLSMWDGGLRMRSPGNRTSPGFFALRAGYAGTVSASPGRAQSRCRPRGCGRGHGFCLRGSRGFCLRGRSGSGLSGGNGLMMPWFCGSGASNRRAHHDCGEHCQRLPANRTNNQTSPQTFQTKGFPNLKTKPS